jgi:hypothetical protein
MPIFSSQFEMILETLYVKALTDVDVLQIYI